MPKEQTRQEEKDALISRLHALDIQEELITLVSEAKVDNLNSLLNNLVCDLEGYKKSEGCLDDMIIGMTFAKWFQETFESPFTSVN